MGALWSRIKNILKRFFPLTIHRFDQETWSTRGELAALERGSEEEIGLVRQSIEGQNLLQLSVNGLSERLSSLEVQVEQLVLSAEKLNGITGVIHRRSDRLERCMIHCMPRAELSFEIALAEHCDLNCAGCDHFSPLAEPKFADIEETARDLARLSELFHGHAKEIQLLGGEPLLHPNLTVFFKMARECFPEAIITLTTNGLRLLSQPEEFWLSCRDNGIVICPTKYPVPLDFEEMERRAAEFGVQYRYFGNTGAVEKSTNYYRMDVEGRQDGSRNFLLCHRANTCVYLQHGRLYTCTVAPTVYHFNKYFGTEMKVVSASDKM